MGGRVGGWVGEGSKEGVLEHTAMVMLILMLKLGIEKCGAGDDKEDAEKAVLKHRDVK